MRTDDRIRVQHMIDAGESVVAFTSGRVRDDLGRDRMLLFAVVRGIEVLGETASRVSDETRSASPQIPWSAIVAMRHRLVHGYFDVDPDVVWRTARDEVPALPVQLHALVDD
jgi:uncharacterized protein with HEPN domain